MAITVLNELTFQSVVAQSAVPVLVDFYADWCQPCRMLTPALDAIAAENGGKLMVCKVDVDQNQRLAAEYGVISIPNVVCFKGGKVHKRSVGVAPKADLLALTT